MGGRPVRIAVMDFRGMDARVGSEAGEKLIRVFFFEQKTANEVSACLVCAEMCMRDGSRILMEMVVR